MASSAGSILPSKWVGAAAVYYGFAVIFTESCGLREYIILCHGSELYIAFFLLFWLLSAATGALVAPTILRYIPQKLPFLFPLIGFFTFFFGTLFFGRNSIQGLVPSPEEALAIAAFEATPVALLSGMFFVLLCRQMKPEKVYALEAVGITVGGVLLDTAFLPLFGNYFSLLLLTTVAVLFLRNWTRHITGVVLLTLLLFTPTLEKLLIEKEGVGRVVMFKHTYAGRMSIREVDGEDYFFRNGMPQMPNRLLGKVLVTLAERAVGEGKVLLISSNPTVLEEESSKRNWRFVSFASDVPTASILRRYFHTETTLKDVRSFVTETEEKFSVALIEVSLPSSSGENRIMTREFFETVSNRCGGILVVVPYPEGAPPESYRLCLKALLKAVESVFGETELFRIRGCGLLITTFSSDELVLTPFGEVEPLELKLLLRSLESLDVAVNSDTNPVCMRYGIAYQSQRLEMDSLWSILMASTGIIIFLLLLSLLVFLCSISSLTGYGECGVLVAVGATGISLQLVLLLLFQSTFGMLYGAIGMMIALFMAGCATGALSTTSVKPSKRNILLVLICYGGLLLSTVAFSVHLRSGIIGFLLFFLLNAVSGFLVGFNFGLVVQRIRASLAYGVDLLGAAAGTISSFFLIPIAGAISTLLILLLLITTTALFYSLRSHLLHRGSLTNGEKNNTG